VWTPKKFEFSNMFSYGENNVVDFSKMNGIIGLFGRNGSGKSAILGSLLFCLFDKCPSTNKAGMIMNSEKRTFRCKFNFSIDNIDYFIERRGEKDKKGSVKVGVKFWKEIDGNVIELNGEARNSTNDIIRSYIGTYDDFIMTSYFSNANREGNYIDLGQTEKKDLLARFMGLLIFDRLNEESNKKYLELSALSKKYESVNYASEIEKLTSSIATDEKTMVEIQSRLTDSNLIISNLNSELLEYTKKLHNITASDIINVPSQELKKIELSDTINKSKVNIIALKNSLAPIITSIENLEKEIKNTPHIQINMENYKLLKEKLVKLNLQLENKKTIVLQKKEKLTKLEEHKFDPNCEFCINNVFVKDAIATKTSIEIEKSEARNLLAERSKIKEEISNIEPEIEKNNVLNEKKSNLVSLYTNKNSIENSILKSENDINKHENSIKDIDIKIKSFKENENKIKENAEINIKINSIKSDINQKNQLIKSINSELISENSKIIQQKAKLVYVTNDYNTALYTEKSKKIYEYYTQITSRNGLPYQLITKAIPIVENEINNILNQIVSFNVSFEYDDKNINAYFVKDGRKWSIETISGFERFVCSLAIRISLINSSCISRPNGFVSIDEGFDSVDSINIASMNTLFQYLRSAFKHIIVITHTDSIKDSVDSTIDINQIDGFSHVNYD
jgi:DNA repair exonuclease SbcCD ATPase subunit